MTRFPSPPLDGLARRLQESRAAGSAGSAGSAERADSFVRRTYTLPRADARNTAREWFERYPKAAYWTAVERWRLLPGDEVEFTMRRLPSAD